MTNNLNAIFSALADPTRRAVIDQLLDTPARVSDLHAPHSMALPTFMKHLKVLHDAGLVHSKKQGRERFVTLTPAPLSQVNAWLTQYADQWDTRMDRLSALAANMERTKT